MGRGGDCVGGRGEKTSSAKSEEASPGKRQRGGDWEQEKSSPDKGEAGKEQHSWQRDCMCKGPVAEESVADTRESIGWGGRRSECGTGSGEGVSRGLTRPGLVRHAKAMGTVGLDHKNSEKTFQDFKHAGGEEEERGGRAVTYPLVFGKSTATPPHLFTVELPERTQRSWEQDPGCIQPRKKPLVEKESIIQRSKQFGETSIFRHNI